MEQVKQLLDFIEKSPSCYQAVENAVKELENAGYLKLKENQKWELAYGGKYYVTRNDSALIAFQIPAQKPSGFHMIASHSDSPCFKIKENPEMTVENQYVKLNVEKYGGMILSTWLDRPLSVAGRVVVRKNPADLNVTNSNTAVGDVSDKDATDRSSVAQEPLDNRQEAVTKHIAIHKDMFIIPNVAIHMNRDMNKGVEYNVQTDMLPLYGGSDSANSFLTLIAEAAGAETEDILGMDLFLYNRQKSCVFGAKGEFIGAPRLDDLGCVYASLQAILGAIPRDYVNVMVVFDNEEVGSSTRQGAASTFLQDTLEGICEAMEWTQGDYRRLLADSFMLSADNAHAVHPNHPEKADPTNRPYLNGGVVIKYHGSQKYTTDAVSAAMMKDICNRAGVPWQTYANRSDIAGGSTLGNISTTQVPVNTVDIGLPQLAMHSAYETAGAKDIEYMVKAMQCFYEA